MEAGSKKSTTQIVQNTGREYPMLQQSLGEIMPRDGRRRLGGKAEGGSRSLSGE